MKTTSRRILAGTVGSLLLALGAVAAPATAAPAPTIASYSHADHPRDFNGDGNADLLARDSQGNLWLYPGNGYGGFDQRRKIGTGWGGMTAIVTGYFTLGGHNDIIARDRAGDLWLYPGTGHGRFEDRTRIGRGWNAFTVIQNYSLSPVYSGLLVRDRSGDLWNYGFNTATGHFYRHPRRLGWGWNTYTAIVFVGDWNGDDDYGDVVAQDRSGHLWVYAEDPFGTFYPRRRMAGAAPRLTQFISPWDWDGSNGMPDIMGKDAHGNLWVFSPTVRVHRIGIGWNGWILI